MQCVQDFGNLDEPARNVEEAEAHAAFDARIAEEEDDDEGVAAVNVDVMTSTFTSAVGTRQTPLSADHFRRIACEIAGPRKDDRDPGFLSYSGTLRGE